MLPAYKCFLDEDSEEAISDLPAAVAASRALIFVLSTNIFDSVWCLTELREAVKAGIKIVLITQAGAKWELDGRQHDFPPQSIIPEDLRPAFGIKGQNRCRQDTASGQSNG
jgi:hypothetical protein